MEKTQLTNAIKISNLGFSGNIKLKSGVLIYETLIHVSHTFHYGSSVLINGDLGKGGWALSWILGGALKQQQGIITDNKDNFSLEDRRLQSWLVRDDISKTGLFRADTVKNQIRYGLIRYKSPFSEEEIIRTFYLTPERYNRPLHQLGNEAWRASLAIGIANGRKVFCFPFLETKLIEVVFTGMFEQIARTLKNMNCLIVIPCKSSTPVNKICDDILLIGEQ